MNTASPKPAHDAAELAGSLLAELRPDRRAEFLTDQLVQLRDLRALTCARNRLTDAIEDLINEQFGADE